jgi:Rrf2 family protein
MKLTRASAYAIHAIAYMAEKRENGPVASHSIARARGIPERFLLKVLKPLADRKILISMKGPNGGYRLAKPAAQISLLEVVEAVDGPIRGLVPLTEHASNEKVDQKLTVISDQAADATRRQLQKVSVAELVGKTAKKK